MLKMTGVKLQKISDIDVHLFLKKGMRGGISYIQKDKAQVVLIRPLCIGMQIICMVGP